ncbi:hypothetical protein [Candidatus Viridilinea mediisalina]|uniref:DUF2157 domain-containing protein n=1 Tax=Candidatus Viridilinea mediisalina TaxID=2024553 RepID=A0A2A6RH60_9CHLR|nr:hypothetical protein [Candidatus Viridilinea mediisalina]PDW02215.1 hypothetical protein CJ255_15145 [Candidatus Viridilinea mediisalina]
MEILILLLLLLFCFVLPWLLTVVLAWRLWRSSRKPPPAPQAPDHQLGDVVRFERMLARWAADGRLDAALVDQVRDLLADEWQAQEAARLKQPPQPTTRSAASPEKPPRIDPASDWAELAEAIQQSEQARGVTPAPNAAASRPSANEQTQRTTPAPNAAASAALDGTPRTHDPVPTPSVSLEQQAGAPPARATHGALAAALLALGTRRTLLFLGSFLLVMSGLTLVIFSWASFPPFIQLLILAGTTAGLWGGGALMQRKADLVTAGQNLQLVAALLIPVVGFALGRPGLLDLAPRLAWQLTSGLSFAAYAAAAWRTGRAFYSGGSALAMVSLLLALLAGVERSWQVAPLLWLLAILLLVAAWLAKGAHAPLAEGPRWVALVGIPLGLVAALLFAISDWNSNALAASLLSGTFACAVAYWRERQSLWLWASIALPIAVAPLLLGSAETGVAWNVLALAITALLYLGLSSFTEAQHTLPVTTAPLARPFGSLALITALVACAGAWDTSATTQVVLPLLALFGMALLVVIERGQWHWLGDGRKLVATLGLLAAGLLLGLWIEALLVPHMPNVAQRVLFMTPLAVLFFVAARWWPGRLNAAYDLTLQSLGSVALLVAAWSLSQSETRLIGALLLTLALGGQATLRQFWLWAALSLGALNVVAFSLVESVVDPSQLEHAWMLTALGLAASYSLVGERLRRTTLRYWTWPGVVWGCLWGLFAVSWAAVNIFATPTLSSGIFLGCALLLGLHTALWRRGELGYAVASLLVAATLTAAGQGFFTTWRPSNGELGYIVAALALGLGLLGQGLRRKGRSYGLPYELVAFGIMPGAPMLATVTGGGASEMTLILLSLTTLYSAALWHYRQPWLLALAFFSFDVGLLYGASWLLPSGDPAGAGLIWVSAVVVQSLLSLWMRRTMSGPFAQAGAWGYTINVFVGLGALLLAASSSGHLAIVAGILALLLALLSWFEAHEALAWGSLTLLGLMFSQHYHWLNLSPNEALLAGSLTALGCYVLGWGIQALLPRQARLAIWRRPLEWGLGATSLLIPLLLVEQSLTIDQRFLGAGLFLVGVSVGMLGWRLRMPFLAGVSLVAWSSAISSDMLWGTASQTVAMALVVLIGVQVLAALAKRSSSAIRLQTAIERPTQLHRAIYVASGLSSLLAILLSLGGSALGPTVFVLLSLAALSALSGSIERQAGLAWLSLVLGLAGGWLALELQGLAPAWIAAWLILGLVGLSLVGWVVVRFGLTIWALPTGSGALGAALLLTLQAALGAIGTELLALTFALANLGLLLATLAVRERQLGYVYAAVAAFIAALFSQMADWGIEQAQWYVVPTAIYLLALASGLRRFQHQHRLSQVIESVAVVMLLGLTFIQNIHGTYGTLGSLLLFGEALGVMGYGMLMRLRVPFVGGIGFFVAGVLWMTSNAVQLTNQWVLLGIVGLLMVAAYVILERHQERLVRAGRAWAEHLRGWG